MPRILVVDDEPNIRHLIIRALEHDGHVVSEAVDGREAATKLQEQEFDLLITDIVMPERDGLETIISLRRDKPAVPVIAMSGTYAMSEVFLRAAKNLGARRILVKPFTIAGLLKAADEVLAEGGPPS